MKAGGSLLVLGDSGLDQDKTGFVLDVGAEYVGPAAYWLDYLVAGPELSKDMVASPFLNYTAAMRARLTDGVALAAIKEPYFDRTYEHYCSHMNTPYRTEDAPQPGAWRKGNLVYLAHPLGGIYYHHGARLHRQLFVNALRLLYTRQVVTVQLPSAGRVNLVHQPDRRRYVAHLMYAPPLQRGRCLVIEDMPALYDVPVSLDVPEKVARVYLAPSKIELPLESVAPATVGGAGGRGGIRRWCSRY